MIYNLEKRTKTFSKNIINLLNDINKNEINRNIISQLIRSATSIGANYCEANNASSKKDFKNKIYICKKEAMETKHWLRMLATSISEHTRQIRILWKECQELTLIFSKIAASSK